MNKKILVGLGIVCLFLLSGCETEQVNRQVSYVFEPQVYVVETAINDKTNDYGNNNVEVIYADEMKKVVETQEEENYEDEEGFGDLALLGAGVATGEPTLIMLGLW